MAQYKVPQDVEAEDKLLGPFTFRQFIYLLIAFALGGIAFVLFQIFPVLVIIPIPFIVFLFVLALPLKKDQPMETYLAAVISYYTKPHKRIWEPGEAESTIVITAPKKQEENRTKDISQEEASHRLSFLANIVDTEGYAIKGGSNMVTDEVNAEASTVEDIFETHQNYNISQTLQTASDIRHNELVEQMRQAIDNTRSISSAGATINKFSTPAQPPVTSQQQQSVTVTPTQIQPVQPPAQQPSVPFVNISQPDANQSITRATLPTPGTIDTTPTRLVAQPVAPPLPQPVVEPTVESVEQEHEAVVVQPLAKTIQETQPESEEPKEPSQEIINLANNSDFSIETIAKQAKRINEKNDGEVYISLH